MTPLLPVAEAQARLLALAGPLPIEQTALVAAAGRRAAADIYARRDQPAADLSAMDGYAVRHADLPGPWRIVGESAAGRGLDRAIEAGEAARIFTGAPLPLGADTILIQEDATRDGDTLTLTGDAPVPRQWVRALGSEFRTDTPLIEAHALLTPARIVLAAIGGHGTLAVRRLPRITLISTGDELVPAGSETMGSALPSSNAPMLAAMLAGRAEVYDAGIVPDRLDALVAAFAKAQDSDVIVTTGGASVGDHDLVRPALAQAGATLDFWRIAMRPGKPLLAGTLGGAIVLGLPGNPVSAFVTARLFLLPLVARLAGDPMPLPVTQTARLRAPLAANGARADYIRAVADQGGVLPLPVQDSAGLSVLAAANALISRAPCAAAVREGDLIDIIFI